MMLFNELASSVLLLAPLLFAAGALWAHYRPLNALFFIVVRWLIAGLFLLSLIAVALSLSHHSTSSIIFLSLQPANTIMLSLIMLMALIIITFSQRYMQGEACYARYFTWILFTLSAVSITVVSDHLLLFWVGWVAISLCLHQLLTLYPERPRALLAAHKKFALARAAEGLLLVAFIMLYAQYETGSIQAITGFVLAAGESTTLPWITQLAVVFIALAALIKCAQLPFHGWLIKVVETPTPVSALLHAGVINLGGFVLIVFAPLLSLTPLAQWLVLVVAGMSTLLAALIMTTRISVKVRLAWSTSAQMGMMLVQCALGLYELALLHLVMHSLYKAHQFLSAGFAVDDYNRQQWLAKQSSNIRSLVIPGVLAMSVALLTIAAITIGLDDVWPVSIVLLLAAALTHYVIERPVTSQYFHAHQAHSKQALTKNSFNKRKSYAVSLVVVIGMVMVYGISKHAFEAALGLPTWVSVAPLSFADLWITLVVITLIAASVLLKYFASSSIARRLSIALFCGFHLDERFTRWLMIVWPGRHRYGTQKSK